MKSERREFTPGSLVRVRNRNWTVLPSEDSEVLKLRPLGGSESETTGIYLKLKFPEDEIVSTRFQPPTVEDLGDLHSAHMLREAARLSFRDVAGPFRSLGKLSFRPRAYQMVPLIMALKQGKEPVRLLIADDVGIGKTVEALLIVKELLERREIQRFAIICLPHLCEQWQSEIKQKFGIEAVIIRSNTAAKLDREIRGDVDIFQYFRYQVISIDYIKSDSRRDRFVMNCPELVIVDEAHTATRPEGARNNQQQRYHLINNIARKAAQHLILLTATPHSGKSGQFHSLLGLLKPEFETLDLPKATRKEREQLAKHFVQRRRADVLKWMGEQTPFPERDTGEFSYKLSPRYAEIYNEALLFAKGLTEEQQKTEQRQKLRYWTALALLRGIMSSPAAGAEMLRNRLEKLSGDKEEDDLLPDQHPVMDKEEGFSGDMTHKDLIERTNWKRSQRKKLNELAAHLENLGHLTYDKKAARAEEILSKWVQEGFHAVVFCRYISTANYLGRLLKEAWKNRPVEIQVVTSEDPDEVRKQRIDDMRHADKRVLIATDCLSEGINLQEHFTAVLHYDLPWNPNRLEQREGRVDRYGQTADQIKAYLLYGRDNPIDGVVLKVLLRKVREIRKSIGISIPFPENNESVMDAVLQAVLLQPIETQKSFQLSLDFGQHAKIVESEQKATHAIEEAAEREKASRSIFAQHSVKASEIEQDLLETDKAIGDPAAVEQFVLEALPRFFGAQVAKDAKGYIIYTTNLPGQLKDTLPHEPKIPISFHSPTPKGYHYIGRNHLFVEQLCQYLMSQSLDHQLDAGPARAAVIRTPAVETRTILMIFRVRMVIESVARQNQKLVAEEMLNWGYRTSGSTIIPLSEEEIASLLNAPLSSQSLSPEAKQTFLLKELDRLPHLASHFNTIAEERTDSLLQAHERFRKALGGKRYQAVKPVLPMDVMGIYILLPEIHS